MLHEKRIQQNVGINNFISWYNQQKLLISDFIEKNDACIVH